MTNKEKIEEWIGLNSEILRWEYESDINEELFFYILEFSTESNDYSATYDISVLEDGSISYLPHLR